MSEREHDFENIEVITLTTEERRMLVGDLERIANYLVADEDNQDAQGMASDCHTVIRVLCGEGVEP